MRRSPTPNLAMSMIFKNHHTRSFLGVAALLVCLLPLPAVLAQPAATDSDNSPELAAAQHVTPETQAAIDRGLAFLAEQQQADGAFGSGGYSRNVAVCAVSGMALMSSGSTPGRGPYGAQVDKCVDYILQNVRESGYIVVADDTGRGPMYGHGFATLFLAEASGMSRRPDIREKLGRAVRLIVKSQNKQGGWRYQPQSQEADISVTVCQIMALRAARNAGVHVPRETVDRCIDYVKRSQNTDGGFMYTLDGGDSAFPRSAAGVVALYSAGVYQGAAAEGGLEYLEQFAPGGSNQQSENHFFYGHYYGVQAMWHAGGSYWTNWYPAIRDALVDRQRDDGSWNDSICNEYGTAMACLILQMPNNYLPIFQR